MAKRTADNVSDPVAQNWLQTSASLTEYLSYIGIHNATLLGHKLETMIVSCHFRFAKGVLQSSVPCSDLGHFKAAFNPFHLNCFTISFNRDVLFSSGPNTLAHIIPRIQGIEIALYLDNHAVSILEPYEAPASPTGSTTGSTTGAVVTAHAHGTLADTGASSFLIKPGTSYYFTPEVTLRKRLEPRHGMCEEGIEYRKSFWSLDQQRTNYSYYPCGMANIQRVLYERCGCISPTLQVLHLIPYFNFNKQYSIVGHPN